MGRVLTISAFFRLPDITEGLDDIVAEAEKCEEDTGSCVGTGVVFE